MSKSPKKKNTKFQYDPQEVLDDINKILNLTTVFEEDLTELDLDKFNKKVDKINKEIREKYISGKKNLDSKK